MESKFLYISEAKYKTFFVQLILVDRKICGNSQLNPFLAGTDGFGVEAKT